MVKDIFTQQVLATSIPELIAAATGIASVWFAKKENILVYPVGIVSVLIYVYVYFGAKLYADATINIYYFAVSVYGWYYWKHGGKKPQTEETDNSPIDRVFDDGNPVMEVKEEAPIKFNTMTENIYFLVYTFVTWIVLGILLNTYTNSDVPWYDSLTTAIFFIAMILMAKKRIENWVYWLIADAAIIPLCIYKGLYFTAFQYLIFTIIAIAGFLSWYRKLQHAYEEQTT